jgi:tetratricopeptide (TPR) repeat protein
MDGFVTREVASLLGLTEVQVRGFARAGGIVRIRGRYHFGFRDLVLLRGVADLVTAQIPARRVVRELIQLKDQLPANRTLSEIRLAAEGGRVVAYDGNQAWNPETGQYLFSFVTETHPAGLSLVTPPPSAAAEDRDEAEEWFELGGELESSSAGAAIEAYERALALAPDHADAHVNLGRLLHEQDRTSQAASHYRLALESEPNHETAAFNLGVALEDEGCAQEAMQAYRHALESNPGCADAHYNLAKLYELSGDTRAALRHLHRYRELKDPGAVS